MSIYEKMLVFCTSQHGGALGQSYAGSRIFDALRQHARRRRPRRRVIGFGKDPVIEITRQELRDEAARELLRFCPDFEPDGSRIPQRMINKIVRDADPGMAAKIRGIVRRYNRYCEESPQGACGPSRRRDMPFDRHVPIAVSAAA